MLTARWTYGTFLLLSLGITTAASNFASFRKRARSATKPFPMLYFSSQEKVILQSRSSDTHEKIAREIRLAGQEFKKRPDHFLPPKNHSVFASRWNEVYGNNLCCFAMYCFLFPQDEAAFDLVTKFMDNMASYPDWYVAVSYNVDEVPIGHSLNGFATAFDILHDRFDSARKRDYLSAIKKHSQTLYLMLSKNRHGWSRQYIHNHAATNIVALLMGGLVTSISEPEIAFPWISISRERLDFAMEILKHVTDGSLDEGVSYGSYTSRGLTTYVYLAKRHFGVDHTSNPWIKNHFWFYYKTILPGFQRAAGIGDANHNWFFGPCSQLVFLDSFILKNGYGNWLADQIRLAIPKNKPFAPSNSSVYSTLHTEYIFYNASIEPIRPNPNPCRDSKLHVYHDWGVATYGAGLPMKAGNTFLSFKSAVPNGEAVENIRLNKRYPSKINGWKSFNPGHEHPDQNSFTFAPNGRYFITEALYGPKLTILDNTYSFSPSKESNCNQPWEGQIGECFKWLKYNDFQPGMRGQILSATTSKEMVFMAGEAGAIYRKSLGIASFYRGVLLLNPEVLIVVDSFKLRPGSKTKFASATFHNMLHAFKPYRFKDYQGAQIRYPEGSYKLFAMNIVGKRIAVTLHEGFRPEYLREGPTNYINATFPLEEDVTTVAYIFAGPLNPIRSAVAAKFGSTGVSIKLDIKGVVHEAKVTTAWRSWSKKTSAAQQRIKFLGFPGYASVRVDSKLYRFGYEVNPPLLVDRLSRGTSAELSKSGTLHCTLPDFDCRNSMPGSPCSANVKDSDCVESEAPTLVRLVTGISFLLVAVIAIRFPQTRTILLRKIRSNLTTVMRACIVLLLLIWANLCCIRSDGSNSCIRMTSLSGERKASIGPSAYPSSPLLFSFSLPGCGGHLIEHLFGSPTDFLVLSSTDQNLAVPVDGIDSTKPDLCSWSPGNTEIGVIPSGWLTSVILRPLLHFNQQPTSKRVSKLRRRIREYPSTTLAFVDNCGFWMTKIKWIASIVDRENFLPVLVVRDPRSWIYAIINDSNRQRRKSTISSLLDAYDRVNLSCNNNGATLPDFHEIANMSRTSSLSLSEKLAVIWTVAYANALSSTGGLSHPLHIVRFEDLTTNPDDASTDLFSRLGFPLGVKHISNISRIVNGPSYDFAYDGTVNSHTGKVDLPTATSKRISQICYPLLAKFGYS